MISSNLFFSFFLHSSNYIVAQRNNNITNFFNFSIPPYSIEISNSTRLSPCYIRGCDTVKTSRDRKFQNGETRGKQARSFSNFRETLVKISFAPAWRVGEWREVGHVFNNRVLDFIMLEAQRFPPPSLSREYDVRRSPRVERDFFRPRETSGPPQKCIPRHVFYPRIFELGEGGGKRRGEKVFLIRLSFNKRSGVPSNLRYQARLVSSCAHPPSLPSFVLVVPVGIIKTLRRDAMKRGISVSRRWEQGCCEVFELKVGQVGEDLGRESLGIRVIIIIIKGGKNINEIEISRRESVFFLARDFFISFLSDRSYSRMDRYSFG